MLNPLLQYEAAEQKIAAGETSLALCIDAVLALARGGATDLALSRFHELGLASATLSEDAQALLGRLLKDQAMALSGAARTAKLLESGEAYQRAFDLTGGYYSGINAATLYTLAGQSDRGLELAQRTGALLSDQPHADRGEERYYQAATLAEIHLLKGDLQSACRQLSAAIEEDPENINARATTLRQFLRILEFRDQSSDWLEPLRPPALCFFAGSMPSASRTADGRSGLAQDIRNVIKSSKIGEAYGALAAGRDIEFSEIALEEGVRLHLVLPVPLDAFREHSVAAFGACWEPRFTKCLEAASSVQVATQDQSLLGHMAIQYAAEIAMGTVIRLADTRMSQAVQVLVDPKPGSMTEALGDAWSHAGKHPSLVLRAAEKAERSTHRQDDEGGRVLSAMLFADLFRFSQLDHAQTLATVKHVLGPLAEVLDTYSDRLHHLNSWGDGIFAAFHSASDAADAALEMQTRLGGLDLESVGLPKSMSLRIGAHYGPVSCSPDPVTRRNTLYGSHVAQAAKIEPLAVPGSILASESFAAALALSGRTDISASYVGKFQLSAVEHAVRLFALGKQAA